MTLSITTQLIIIATQSISSPFVMDKLFDKNWEQRVAPNV